MKSSDTQRQTEANLAKNNGQLEKMLKIFPDLVSIHDPNRNILYSNWNGLGALPEEKQVLNTKCYKTYWGRENICPECRANEILHNKEPIQEIVERADGKKLRRHIIPILDDDNNVECFAEWVRDITEQMNTDAAEARAQAELNQSRKMESIGRLAGGVAHDFNNKLAVIMVSADMAKEAHEEGKPIQQELETISETAKRSAGMTRQLLAFARKQIISPLLLELNETTAEMIKMLDQMTGENIKLHWRPSDRVIKTKIDPAQLNQLLTHLVLNARDATCEKGGEISIETDIAEFSETRYEPCFELLPGRYAVIAVSDNGSGMSREVLTEIFEPFYTTKRFGKNAGFGLATVYGILKQNKGFINVYSEPGQGSVFRIYLPLQEDKSSSPEEDKIDQEPSPKGSETILLVEDDQILLNMTKIMLSQLGYQVLTAETAKKALELSDKWEAPIDLLLTDMIMPETNGSELREQIRSRRPGTKCLFISGFTVDTIVRQGIMDTPGNLLEKPFSKKDLACKIRKVIA